MEHFIPNLLLTSVEYGGYISIVKFAIFLVLFFLWLPLVGWVYTDSEVVNTRQALWTAAVFGTGVAATIVWLVVPLFIVGMLLYLIVMGSACIAYVIHRNAKVPDFDKVLTIDHIKGLFMADEAKKLDSRQKFVFITANNNEVPVPQAKTQDFYGYKVAHDVFTDAVWKRASSIMFYPAGEQYNVIYRIDGVDLKQPPTDRQQMDYFIRFAKHLGDLNINERRKPQKGNFKIRQQGEELKWEVITAGSTVGEQLHFRQIAQESVKKLADIGLMPEQQEQLDKIRDLHQGLFIVSGPKKSGVTTTAYALLRNHDAFLNSINTLERQPSVELPNITQSVFTSDDATKATYGKKLRAIVRMGPDIVGVADCTDTETAQVACETAKDGRIVYVVLTADSVMQALAKWLKLVGDRNLATEALLGISNQRMVRQLCGECRQGYEPNKDLLKKFNIPSERAKVLYRPGKVQYDKHGKPMTCEHCQGTGYFGRTGVFEIITINDELRKAIRQSKSLPEISMEFRRAKMLYLREQALRKVISGTTAINEMVRILAGSKKSMPKKRRQKAQKPESPDVVA